ncbi:MAG: response regulator, partial [Desulfobulbaceae bacterium]|nr:response regulator [Desulfobulbaceae bacterium]
MDISTQMQCILIVDDEPNNLKVLQQILRDNYRLVFAKNGAKALTATTKHSPDLILLDIMMPDMDGYEVCRKLKANPTTANIPVIFVTALNDESEESKGFSYGCVDYITKPVSGPIVRARVQNHLALYDNQRACNMVVLDKTAQLELSQRTAIHMLGEAGHYNDADTGIHVWRMAAYSRAIAEAADWSVNEAKILELAAPMHDTGKIGIPDAILKKPAKLDAEEWRIMKTHTTIGRDILSKS